MAFIETIGILDLVLGGILLISVLVGLIRGAIREVLSLVGLAVAIYLAFTFAEMLSNKYVSKLFEEPQISYIVTFVLIILASVFAIALINMFFSQLLRASGLSFVNRFLGMVFGALRGAVIGSVIVLALSFIPGFASKSWWKASAMVPLYQSATEIALEYLPADTSSFIDNTEKQVQNTIDKVSANMQKSQNTDSLGNKMQEIQKTAETTSRVLKSISDSANDTRMPQIQLESGEDNSNKAINGVRTSGSQGGSESDKSSLTLESYN